MTIQEVAKQTGISAYTIRFYEKAGVLPPIKRLPNGRRAFTVADITYLRFLSQLKQTGMSLEQIAAFLEGGCMLERLQHGEAIPPEVAEKRVTLLKRHQQQLMEQRQLLDALLLAVQQKLAFYMPYQSDRSLNARANEQIRLEQDSCASS